MEGERTPPVRATSLPLGMGPGEGGGGGDLHDPTYATSKALWAGATHGHLPSVRSLLAAGAHWFSDPLGRTPLHMASSNGHKEVVEELLMAGHPWNVTDKEGLTAGEYAERAGHADIYETILQHGVRTELLLGVLGRKPQQPTDRAVAEETGADEKKKEEEEEEKEKEEEKENEGKKQEDASTSETESTGAQASNGESKHYLEQRLHYSDEKLLDSDNNAVMMGWEGPLMLLHAQAICPRPGLSVLNVGFGLGLVDSALQTHKPGCHTIIEAHPDVYAHMIELGWNTKPGVRIHFGRWQEVLPKLEAEGIEFDGIFFDTYAEFYEDLRDFHEHLPALLRPNGRYSFFNGLGATNSFFHHVYRLITEIELEALGLHTHFTTVPIDPAAAQIWAGVERRYWRLQTYYLPVCAFSREVLADLEILPSPTEPPQAEEPPSKKRRIDPTDNGAL